MSTMIADLISPIWNERLSVTSLIAVCCLILVTYCSLYLKKQRCYSKLKRPPQVPGCPLLGNIFGIDSKRPHFTLTEWGKKYGDIFSIRVLREDIIVLNSVELIREALIDKSKSFAGRPNIFRINYGFHYSKDIIFGTLSPKWLYMKRVASQGLRSFGTGCHQVEMVVEEEMRALVDVFRQHHGSQFDPRLTLMTAVVNGITAAVIGKRYGHEDSKMAQYKLTTRLFSESCSVVKGMELDMFPWLRFVPYSTIKKLDQSRDMLDELVDSELISAKAAYDPDNPRCILDVLMKARDTGDSEAQGLNITDSDIRSIFIDLLVAGTFTTAVSLSAFVIIMINDQKLQGELRGNILKVVKNGRLPSSGDRQHIPLMEATILEILRYLSHVPLNLPHFTTEDTTLGGYNIPKNTQVLTNLWSVHHDVRVWTDPWSFNPRRFLDDSNHLLPPTHQKRKNLFPFSAGRRQCLGENIARERLFLFCCVLLQNFTLLPPEDATLISPDPREFDLGLILEPKAFKVKVLTRE